MTLSLQEARQPEESGQYFLFGVVQGVHGAVAGWRRGKLERRLAVRQSAEA